VVVQLVIGRSMGHGTSELRPCDLVRHLVTKSRDSFGLDDLGSRVRFPAGAGNFSLHHSVQNGSGAHPASYPMGTRALSLGGKASGA
jgi:hypothetical protein